MLQSGERAATDGRVNISISACLSETQWRWSMALGCVCVSYENDLSPFLRDDELDPHRP
jgi:hypothetical protein